VLAYAQVVAVKALVDRTHHQDTLLLAQYDHVLVVVPHLPFGDPHLPFEVILFKVVLAIVVFRQG
jgi:hypothetical protein